MLDTRPVLLRQNILANAEHSPSVLYDHLVFASNVSKPFPKKKAATV